MKNKEIEELLNNLKWYVNVDNEPDYNGEYPPPLEWEQGEVKLLLSYIEQLEKRNKQLYEGFMATQEELTDYATKNEQLENNRDKAIEYINIETQGCEENPLEGSWLYDLYLIRDILKGDSDE